MLEPGQHNTLDELPPSVQLQISQAAPVDFATDDLPARGEVITVYYFPEKVNEPPEGETFKVVGWHRNKDDEVVAMLGRNHKDALDVVYGDDWSYRKADFYRAQELLIEREIEQLHMMAKVARQSATAAAEVEAAKPAPPYVLCVASPAGGVSDLDRESLDMRGPDLLPGHRFRWHEANSVPVAVVEAAAALIVLPAVEVNEEDVDSKRYKLSPEQIQLVSLFDDSGRPIWHWMEQRAAMLTSAPEDGYIGS